IKEGSESVTFCNRLKMESDDGKMYLNDAVDPVGAKFTGGTDQTLAGEGGFRTHAGNDSMGGFVSKAPLLRWIRRVLSGR
ncbi:MAG: hypothetical protein WCG34_07805, partial [Leptolinea sp.]